MSTCVLISLLSLSNETCHISNHIASGSGFVVAKNRYVVGMWHVTAVAIVSFGL